MQYAVADTFFFFQAEDGIRDYKVTGVQTCALPIFILGIVLPLAGHPPAPPPSAAAWRGVAGLTAGAVLAANFLFFAAVQRIEAAPAAVAATIEPVVGTLLALLLFNQRLSGLGWLGLALVVGGVAVGYLQEAKGEDH